MGENQHRSDWLRRGDNISPFFAMLHNEAGVLYCGARSLTTSTRSAQVSVFLVAVVCFFRFLVVVLFVVVGVHHGAMWRCAALFVLPPLCS